MNSTFEIVKVLTVLTFNTNLGYMRKICFFYAKLIENEHFQTKR